MLSEHDFIIGEGYSEEDYLCAIVFVLINSVMSAPDDEQLLLIDSGGFIRLKQETNSIDLNNLYAIINCMFEYQNSYFVKYLDFENYMKSLI